MSDTPIVSIINTHVVGSAEPVIPGQSPIESGEEYQLALPLAGNKSFPVRVFVPADGNVENPPRDYEAIEFPLANGTTAKGFIAASDLDSYNDAYKKSAGIAAAKLPPKPTGSGVLALFGPKPLKASGAAPVSSTKVKDEAQSKIDKKIAAHIPEGSGARIEYRLNDDGTITNVKATRNGQDDPKLAAEIAASLKSIEPQMPMNAGFTGKTTIIKKAA